MDKPVVVTPLGKVTFFWLVTHLTIFQIFNHFDVSVEVLMAQSTIRVCLACQLSNHNECGQAL